MQRWSCDSVYCISKMITKLLSVELLRNENPDRRMSITHPALLCTPTVFVSIETQVHLLRTYYVYMYLGRGRYVPMRASEGQ